MYNAGLVYSGSSDGVRQKLLSSDFRPRVLLGGDGYYRTGADKPIEHTLYGKPALFWESLEARDLKATLQFLGNGRRGYLLVLADGQDAFTVQPGDKVYTVSA